MGVSGSLCLSWRPPCPGRVIRQLSVLYAPPAEARSTPALHVCMKNFPRMKTLTEDRMKDRSTPECKGTPASHWAGLHLLGLTDGTCTAPKGHVKSGSLALHGLCSDESKGHCSGLPYEFQSRFPQ